MTDKVTATTNISFKPLPAQTPITIKKSETIATVATIKRERLRILELTQKDDRQAVSLALGQFVGAVLNQTRFNFVGGETAFPGLKNF